MIDPRRLGNEFNDLISVLLSKDDVLMLMHSYIDESYKNDLLCMAGYIFRAPSARALSKDWGRMLHRYKLPYFHMTDCNAGKGPFGHLTQDQCSEAQTEAISLIGKYASYGYAVIRHVPMA